MDDDCKKCGDPLCDKGNCHNDNCEDYDEDCMCLAPSNDDIGLCPHGYSDDEGCPECQGGSEWNISFHLR